MLSRPAAPRSFCVVQPGWLAERGVARVLVYDGPDRPNQADEAGDGSRLTTPHRPAGRRALPAKSATRSVSGTSRSTAVTVQGPANRATELGRDVAGVREAGNGPASPLAGPPSSLTTIVQERRTKLDPQKEDYSSNEVALIAGTAATNVSLWMARHGIQPTRRRSEQWNATRYWPAAAVERYRSEREQRLREALAKMDASRAAGR